jgi:hypothetical protein
MAKELIFKLNGTDYGFAPVKLERKKNYGWTDIVANNHSGSVCMTFLLLKSLTTSRKAGRKFN